MLLEPKSQTALLRRRLLNKENEQERNCDRHAYIGVVEELYPLIKDGSYVEFRKKFLDGTLPLPESIRRSRQLIQQFDRRTRGSKHESRKVYDSSPTLHGITSKPMLRDLANHPQRIADKWVSPQGKIWACLQSEGVVYVSKSGALGEIDGVKQLKEASLICNYERARKRLVPSRAHNAVEVFVIPLFDIDRHLSKGGA